MTRKRESAESEMLKLVRQWRKEAYEEWKSATPEQRAKRREKLVRKFGLRPAVDE
jgi:hypothetical protein